MNDKNVQDQGKDKAMIYKTEIEPEVSKIRKLCNQNEIPCFMAFGTDKQKNGKYDMKAISLLPEMFNDKTEDSRFSDFVNVQNGFLTIPASEGSFPLDNFDIDDDIMDIPKLASFGKK
jgi:hypothetical protein